MNAGTAVTTDDLIRHAAAGSPDALAQLFHTYGSITHRTAYGILRNASDADDVTQDLFVALPRALRNYRGDGSLEGWLRRCAVRMSLMRLRSASRRREDGDESLDRVAAHTVSDAVDRISIASAIDQLPESLRLVFVLKAVEGYGHDEIADMLHITEEASRARLARARRELRNLLS